MIHNPTVDQRVQRIAVTAIIVPMIVIALKVFIDNQLTPRSLSCDTLSRQLEVIDSQDSLQRGAMLLLAGEGLSNWYAPPLSVQEQPLLVRAVAGLTPAVVADCFQRSVGFYQPSTLVIVLPIETLHTSITALVDTFKELRDLANYYNVAPEIVVVPPLQAPRDGNTYARFNRLLSELVSNTKTIPGLRIWPLSEALMLTPGQVDASLFWPDGKTLYPQGYERLAANLLLHAQGGITPKTPDAISK